MYSFSTTEQMLSMLLWLISAAGVDGLAWYRLSSASITLPVQSSVRWRNLTNSPSTGRSSLWLRATKPFFSMSSSGVESFCMAL